MSEAGQDHAEFDFKKIDPSSFMRPQRKVKKLFVHCTASDDRSLVGLRLVDEVNRWHLRNGWAGVGYHFLIDKEGSLLQARGLEYTPAAQLGKDNLGNYGTIAFSIHGNWEFTEASLQTAVALVKSISEAYRVVGEPITVHGHCEIDPRPCPIIDYRALFGLDLLGKPFAIDGVDPAIIAKKATRISSHG